MIAARLGVEDAIKLVRLEFEAGLIAKGDYERTKSVQEEVVESMKSHQRDAAAGLYKATGGFL